MYILNSLIKICILCAVQKIIRLCWEVFPQFSMIKNKLTFYQVFEKEGIVEREAFTFTKVRKSMICAKKICFFNVTKSHIYLCNVFEAGFQIACDS